MADPKLKELVRKLAAPRSRPVVHLKVWPEAAEYNRPREAAKNVDRKIHPWSRAQDIARRAKTGN